MFAGFGGSGPGGWCWIEEAEKLLDLSRFRGWGRNFGFSVWIVGLGASWRLVNLG